MSIKINTVERGQPGVTGGGERKFYASAVTDGEISLEGLARYIARMSTLSCSDVHAVLHALVEVMSDSLISAEYVQLIQQKYIHTY